jgi:hypothetical protein
MRDRRGDHAAVCGAGQWLHGASSFLGPTDAERPIAAAGAWTAADTYTAQLVFYEQGVTLTATHTFTDDALRYRLEANVGFGPKKTPQLVGRPVNPAPG